MANNKETRTETDEQRTARYIVWTVNSLKELMDICADAEPKDDRGDYTDEPIDPELAQKVNREWGFIQYCMAEAAAGALSKALP